MKSRLIIFTILLQFISCNSQEKNELLNDSDALKHKTIELTNKFSLYFEKYNNELELWYNPYLIKGKDTIRIEGYSYDNGSELQINISPNKNYIVLDNIIKGYVYESEQDSILHENYGCDIIDLNQSKVVYSMQSECSGNWNRNSDWVVNQEIIFSNLSINNSNVEKINNQAYELEQSGNNEEAIYLLEKIIEAFPNRVVAYLNIADAYWGLAKEEEAKKNYEKYISLMKTQGKDIKRIPQRVYDRIQ